MTDYERLTRERDEALGAASACAVLVATTARERDEAQEANAASLDQARDALTRAEKAEAEVARLTARAETLEQEIGGEGGYVWCEVMAEEDLRVLRAEADALRAALVGFLATAECKDRRGYMAPHRGCRCSACRVAVTARKAVDALTRPTTSVNPPVSPANPPVCEGHPPTK